MKADVESDRSTPVADDTKLYAGRFVRKQGQYGTVAVVGYKRPDGVDTIAEPKRIFPKDGVVETQGLGHHAGLAPGDWVEFDVVKNTRFRAPEYKVHNLKRLPRYAVLPESSIPGYRVLLTGEGWSGDARPGLWAFRLSGDMVIVVDMECGKDGRLRVSRNSARDVKCYRFRSESVTRLDSGAASDSVFLAPGGGELASFDWSDEADHIARVVRSLAGVNDPRFTDIITWLDLHHEEGTGRVSAASGDKEAPLEALRSGELAARLRADRELMEVYLAAALQDNAVRDAVAEYAKEGHGAEWDRLRAEMIEQIAAEKTQQLEVLLAEMAAERKAAVDRIDKELAEHEAAERAAAESRVEAIRRDVSKRVVAVESGFTARQDELEKSLGERKWELERAIREETRHLEEVQAKLSAAEVEREDLLGEVDKARTQLTEAKIEIDRALAIAARLGPTDQATRAPENVSRVGGIVRSFPKHPQVDAAVKGDLIERHVMLSDRGKDALRSLVIMLLAGEVPILGGDQVTDLLRVAESVICPGRFVSIEADPTLISPDDLWFRPGSGAPTMLASAAEAARDGAVLVVIRGIERSGARFWLPALAEALRGGGLPRGLFVCCSVQDREHDEVAALPGDVPQLEVSGIFRPGAPTAGPSLLTHPRIDFETLDPGPMPSDLSAANQIVLELGEGLSLDLAMRTARMFAEASIFLRDAEVAERLVLDITKILAPKPSQ
ncbi:hypothetical protein J2X73_004581 [Novosphingobium sp. 1748]|uniref:hypothetical protein n=1 Tax=Novosphingobium sp. 1748 TaxID=2817760 RepID=UPI0028557F31|nr:hypothetical protein [Novosphingobium sp. 1748]MDR6710176.1 hypothetical protein [Novosphingobium sp. 1748]